MLCMTSVLHACDRCIVQIGRRRTAHLEKNPEAKIISLGIGDTTEPIPSVVTDAMKQASGFRA